MDRVREEEKDRDGYADPDTRTVETRPVARQVAHQMKNGLIR